MKSSLKITTIAATTILLSLTTVSATALAQGYNNVYKDNAYTQPVIRPTFQLNDLSSIDVKVGAGFTGGGLGNFSAKLGGIDIKETGGAETEVDIRLAGKGCIDVSCDNFEYKIKAKANHSVDLKSFAQGDLSDLPVMTQSLGESNSMANWKILQGQAVIDSGAKQ